MANLNVTIGILHSVRTTSGPNLLIAPPTCGVGPHVRSTPLADEKSVRVLPIKRGAYMWTNPTGGLGIEQISGQGVTSGSKHTHGA